MKEIQTLEQIEGKREELESSITNYSQPFAFGVGVATESKSGQILDVFYPSPQRQSQPFTCALLTSTVGWDREVATYKLEVDVLKEIGAVLEEVERNEEFGESSAAMLSAIADAVEEPDVPGGRRVAVAAIIADPSHAPIDAIDTYLRLHLLSTRLVQPHGIDMSGIFGKLTNLRSSILNGFS